MFVSNIIKDNILLLNITKDMGEHQDISWASVELMDYVIKLGSITRASVEPHGLCHKTWFYNIPPRVKMCTLVL